MIRQRYWSPEHRSSSPDNGVDALAELTGLHLGSLHATACGVARSPRRALVRELGASGYPGVPVERVPSLKLPGRAARSRGRTSTDESHGIHGILSGTNSQLLPGMRFLNVLTSVHSKDVTVPTLFTTTTALKNSC